MFPTSHVTTTTKATKPVPIPAVQLVVSHEVAFEDSELSLCRLVRLVALESAEALPRLSALEYSQ